MSSVLAVRGFNPIWSEFDLSGKIFDDTFWMYTLQNTIPYIPQAVFHDPTMNTPWTDPIQFLANGTLPVDIYWLPNATYRLEFRQNNGVDPPSQSDPLIYEVDNYIPSGSGTTPPVTNSSNTSENEISNPQFAVVNFSSPFTISGTNPAALEIAPGWVLNLAGTGTVVINQVPLNDANANASNSPYMLRLTLSGWNTGETYLSQRFAQNGMLWAGKNISGTVTAKVASTPASLIGNLVDSQGAPLGTVLTAVLTTGLQEYTGVTASPLPATTNTDLPPAAYIEYRLVLPNNADIYLSSVQLLVQNPTDISKPTFVQDTVDRQIDHLFHYYNPGLMYKPIPSFLVGWDFPFNPAQPGVVGTTATVSSTVPATAIGANASKYVWDQTIIFQSADSGIGVTRGASGELLLTANNTTQMAIIQYLGPVEARKILNAPICMNISARASTPIIATVSIWYTTSSTLPAIAGNLSIVATLDANGMVATENGSWSQVPRALGNAQFTIPVSSTTNFIDIPLIGWNMQGIAACNTATFIAIVVGTASVTASNTIGFNSVSLQSGTIPTRPAPKTIDQTLAECQTYYRKSFLKDQNPVQGLNTFLSSTSSGESYGNLAYTASPARVVGPIIAFNTQMRKSPVITLFNPVNANANIYDITATADFSSSGVTVESANGFPTTGVAPGGGANGHVTSVHWTADARYGVV